MADWGNRSSRQSTFRGVSGGISPSEERRLKLEGRGDSSNDTGGYTVDDLLPGLQHFESGGRRYAVSPKGAIGLYQIMPGTAAMYGYSPEDMFDPTKNEDVARRYLGDLLNQYNGNSYLAVAAYNAGPGAVNQGAIPPETINHVHNVLGYTSGRQIGQKQSGIRQEPLTAGTSTMFSSRSAPPPEQPDPNFIANSLMSGLFGRGAQPTGGKWPGEGELGTVPQRFDPLGDVESGIGKGYSAFGSAIDSVGPKLGKLFQPLVDVIPKSTPRTPVQAISPDPGETVS